MLSMILRKQELNYMITARYIPGFVNTTADSLSRSHMNSITWGGRNVPVQHPDPIIIAKALLKYFQVNSERPYEFLSLLSISAAAKALPFVTWICAVILSLGYSESTRTSQQLVSGHFESFVNQFDPGSTL